MSATFRRRYGVSVWSVGTSVSWGEACDLVDAALADTSTEICAAVAGWRYPASLPELALTASALGKNSVAVMPWHREPERATDEEIARVHAELIAEIRFTKS